MSKLYYPEVKELKDKHYVELFLEQSLLLLGFL